MAPVGFVVDVGASGERKQTRRRGFPSKREAQAELTRILGSLELQTYVAPKKQTLAAFLTDTWLPAIKHTVKSSTFESYRRNVRLHVAGRTFGPGPAAAAHWCRPQPAVRASTRR